MFENLRQAHTAFADFAPEALLDVVTSLLLPITVLVPSMGAQDTASLTFVGGTPVMSASLDWPVPPLPDDIDEVAGRGGSNHSAGIRKDLERRLPYAFIGQVDLSQLSEPSLPDSGRLLFFYDIAVGPWDTSVRSGKVIWDNAPLDELVELDANENLVSAEAEWNQEVRAYVPEPLVIDDELRKIMLETGMTEAEIDALADEAPVEQPAHEGQNVYFGPKRVMQAVTHYQVPTSYNLEWDAFVQEVDAKHPDTISKDVLGDIFSNAEIEYEYRSPFQILGLPTPVQDDPRYYAAVPLVLDKQFPDSEDWETHEAKLNQQAKELKLLFQVSLADWLQEEFSEGTVYFLISDTDLKNRNFDAVITVYQQT